jgi:hypothetical protein
VSRGTRAALPEGPYERPPAVGADLVVRAVGEDGQDNGTYDFASLPGDRALWEPLAQAFGARTGSGGAWRRKATARNGWLAVRRFVRWMVREYPEVSDLGSLTKAMWDQFLLSMSPAVRNSHGRALRGLLLDTSVLSAKTSRAVKRPIPVYVAAVQRSLSEAEMQVVQRRALKTLIVAERRIRKGWGLVEGYLRGSLTAGSKEERWGRLLVHVVENHDVPRYRGTTMPTKDVQRLLGGTANSMLAFARLYLTAEEAAAAAIGFAFHEGLNKSVLFGLQRSDVTRPDAQDGSEQRIFRVAMDKPRRGDQRFDSMNLVDTSKHSSAYLLGLLISATEPGRRQLADLGLPHDDLILCLPLGMQGRKDRNGPPLTSSGVADGDVIEKALRRWAKSLPAGFPAVHFQAAHRSHTTQRRPQGHTEATNIEVYRLNDARVREAQAPIIANGVQDAFDAMEARVLNTDASAALDIPDDVAAAIDAGDLDTATASCTDHEHSPFDDGRSCTASFLSCLGCRNAVVVPRQLPRLLYLHQRLEGLRGNVNENLWTRHYAAHWMRLTHLLNTKFTPAERTAAERQITDLDRAIIDSLLLRRYDV